MCWFSKGYYFLRIRVLNNQFALELGASVEHKTPDNGWWITMKLRPNSPSMPGKIPSNWETRLLGNPSTLQKTDVLFRLERTAFKWNLKMKFPAVQLVGSILLNPFGSGIASSLKSPNCWTNPWLTLDSLLYSHPTGLLATRWSSKIDRVPRSCWLNLMTPQVLFFWPSCFPVVF